MKLSLVVVQGKPEGLEIPIKGPKFLIGREKKCNLRPNSDLISKLHCLFEIRGDAVLVGDLGSTNGTFVNNVRIESPVVLKNGDIVNVGPLTFSTKIVLEKPLLVEKNVENEEDAMQWLLPDKDGVQAEPGSGSTVMDLRVAAGGTDDTVLDATIKGAPPGDETEPPPSAKPDKEKMEREKMGDTRAAASEILNRYLVRRRIT